ncbi:MAG: ABC transporter permease, partial [Gemmatimonadetes bacterium]|nr:ABC transporter permease [Gemmatimonadota bacterium]
MIGLSSGMISQMINNGTGLVTGQIQIHSPQYLPDRSVYETLGSHPNDVESLLGIIERDPAVIAAAPRVFGGGLASSGASTFPAILMGIDPAREVEVSRIAVMKEGRLPLTGSNEIALGSTLMDWLETNLNDELVLVAPAADGSLGNDLFTVVGIMESGIPQIDGSYVLLPIDVLQSLIALEPMRIHEIVARIDDPWDAPQATDRISIALQRDGYAVDVAAWTSLRPELREYAQLASGTQWILAVIVFSMAIFGVANTMIMATFERRREFALMLALGAAPNGIVRSVLSEALALGLLSLAAGVALTFPILVWWHYFPLDLSSVFGGFEIVGTFVKPVLKTEYPWTMIFFTAFALLLTVVTAALYPAVRAARLAP